MDSRNPPRNVRSAVASAAAAAAPLLLDNQLCFALYSASLAMTKLYKPLLDELGLTYPQYLVMLVLWEDAGLTVSEIGKRLYLDSGTLTPLLKRLEAGALIARLRDTADERQVRISLTAAGRALKTRATAVRGCVFRATQYSGPQLISLTQDIKALRERLMA
jgi:DNA-binding MarR family transcriptional regulator